MKSTKEIIKLQVEDYLIKHQIKNCKIVVALSGGPDSITLINILSIIKEYQLLLVAAYYNHFLRNKTELQKEEELIKDVCIKLGIKHIIGRAEAGLIKKKAKENSMGIEEAARIERYNFLKKVKKNEKADFIATAHNINDNTETMLMRFFSNTGITGLSGIPEKRTDIIRPLSYVNRKLIEDYIKKENLIFSTDNTNNENLFLRNKIRNLILPAVREVFPDVDKNLKVLSEAVRCQNDFINEMAEKLLKWEKTEKGWKIKKEIFFNVQDEIKQKSLLNKLNTFSKIKRINSKSILAVIKNYEAESGKVLLDNRDSIIYVSGEYLFVERLENSNKKSYLLNLREGEKERIDKCDFLLSTEIDIPERKSQIRIFFNAEGPVILRSYREGDKIRTFSGTKTIKKIFNEWSVKITDRDKIAILESPYRIIAVIGEHLGYKNEITEVDENIDKKVLILEYLE